MEQPFERLRHARKAAGFKSASAAARANGWNEAAYRHHENGTRGYGIEQAIAYGEAYSVSPSWLLTLGFSQSESWRLPIGKFYLESLHAQMTYKSGLEEAVTYAHESMGLYFVFELNVTVNSVDPIIGNEGYPKIHFYHPDDVGVDPARFRDGFMFSMRAPKSLARNDITEDDLLLIDSGEGEIKTKPLLWVVRTFDELLVGWGQRQEGVSAFLPDTSKGAALPIDPDANIIGRVCYVGRQT
jgi:hypothetical protein